MKETDYVGLENNTKIQSITGWPQWFDVRAYLAQSRRVSG